jgi:ribosomal protein S26
MLQVAGRRKLDREKIRASLNVKCTHSSATIPPDKQMRIDFEHLRCPSCGQTFTPEKRTAGAK